LVLKTQYWIILSKMIFYQLDSLISYCKDKEVENNIITDINVKTLAYVKKCKKQKSPRHIRLTNTILKTIWKNEKNPILKEDCQLFNWVEKQGKITAGMFYLIWFGLAKLHKIHLPLRPVLSMRGSVYY